MLARADVIACEDTRVTAKLLAVHGISRPLVRYDEHRARAAGPALIERVGRGERVALVTDAGTPLISDPGERLVRDCIDAGLPVLAIPGASAALTALCVSGLPAARFMFAGFLSPRKVARRRELEELRIWGDAGAAEVAETAGVGARRHGRYAGSARCRRGARADQLFEEVRRGTLPDLAAHYRRAGAPKGEVTIVVAPPPPAPPVGVTEPERLLVEALERLSLRDAATSVAKATGLPRRQLYVRAIALKAGA